MCNRHFGSVVAQTIRTQKTDQFPLFLIIMGKRSSNEVLNVIQGKAHVTRGVNSCVCDNLLIFTIKANDISID
jgi:predicted CopG family antitoxin